MSEDLFCAFKRSIPGEHTQSLKTNLTKLDCNNTIHHSAEGRVIWDIKQTTKPHCPAVDLQNPLQNILIQDSGTPFIEAVGRQLSHSPCTPLRVCIAGESLTVRAWSA
ncbi:hypothetical protein CRENBAI_006233 [Crenichthys baileyi]|uniref:Uncharacterized protein n=1 Tax=Crenichthys baileyi TaxID=28760 RepID=A0AAV9QU04_9TELE